MAWSGVLPAPCAALHVRLAAGWPCVPPALQQVCQLLLASQAEATAILTYPHISLPSPPLITPHSNPAMSRSTLHLTSTPHTPQDHGPYLCPRCRPAAPADEQQEMLRIMEARLRMTKPARPRPPYTIFSMELLK